MPILSKEQRRQVFRNRYRKQVVLALKSYVLVILISGLLLWAVWSPVLLGLVITLPAFLLIWVLLLLAVDAWLLCSDPHEALCIVDRAVSGDKGLCTCSEDSLAQVLAGEYPSRYKM